ncbi:MAG TPA: sugar ABC transporter permease [Clostridia bacterium]|nr:sugar ABC transporter permease [Clostridia bacterium]
MTWAPQTAARERKRKNRRTLYRKIKQYRAIYIMVIPVLAYFAIFTFYPLVLGLIQSFQQERLLGKPVFIGLNNYRLILADIMFRRSFRNSVIMGVTSLFLGLACSLFLTLCINEVRNLHVKRAVQTVTFLPSLFSWTVVGSMWIFVMGHNGLVNTLLANLGFARVGFFTTSGLGRPVIYFTGVWKGAGYNAVLMLAAVVTIDPQVFEAARIDGASRMQQIRRIIIPQLGPTIKTLLVLGSAGILRNFDQIWVMNRPATKDSIRSLVLYIYEEGILNLKIGRATAAATVVLVITLFISVLVRKLAKYDQDVSY